MGNDSTSFSSSSNTNGSINDLKHVDYETEIHLCPLSNHQTDFSLQKRREELMKLWEDEKIVDCTHKSAILILIYSTLGKRYKKEAIGSGRCLFYWDQKDAKLLHMKRFEGGKTIDHLFEITLEGLLLMNDVSYRTPQELLEVLTLKTQIVHYRVDIEKDSPLDLVLKKTFDATCRLYYPPEYPPLLVHIAMNNHDYTTAAAILKHPFVDHPSIPRKQNFRLAHLLEHTMTYAIPEGHLSFTAYLLEEYAILASQTYPLKMAIIAEKQNVADYILKRFPEEMLPKAFTEAFLACAEIGNVKLLAWLMSAVPKEISSLPGLSSPQFLAALYEKFGVETFDACVKRLQINISWDSLLLELIKTNCDPRSYLPFYLYEGHTFDEISIDVKATIVLQVLAKMEAVNGESRNHIESPNVQQFLVEFVPSSEHLQILTMALLKVFPDSKKVRLLLDLGAVPSKEHFEALLKVYDGGVEAKQNFTMLLNAISDLSQAQKSLVFASAFGEDAVGAVFEKFPALRQDNEFITLFMSEMWKGQISGTNRLLSEIISTSKTTQEVPELSQKVVLNPMVPALNSDISTDVMVEIFLPCNQINEIIETLSKKPEYTYEFWWKSIFSGYSAFEGPQWEQIVEKTFSPQFINQNDREKLIGQGIFYSHLQLVALWLNHVDIVSPSVVMEWFEEALKSGNAEIVPIFAKHQFLEHRNAEGESLLDRAVKVNAINCIAELLKYGVNPNQKNSTGLTPFDMAYSQNFLTLCRLLRGEEGLYKIVDNLLAMSTQDLDHWLFKAYLNSECRDVDELMCLLESNLSNDSTIDQDKRKAMSDICGRLRSFMQTSGTFIVRFGNPNYQNEVHGGYGKGYASYEEQQRSWGQECERHYQKFLETYRTQDHVILKVLMKLAEVQSKISAETWRMGLESGLITYFHGRYFLFWQYAQKMYKEFLRFPDRYQNELCRVKEGYQVLYKLDEFTILPLSTLVVRKPFKQGVFSARMNHTDSKQIEILLPHLDVLFDEIRNYPMPPVRPLMPPLELKKMIAKLFWLGCHLVITARGSSQFMLMLHRLLYDIHGYSAKSWGLRYVQPDCIAILLPFDLFFNEYYDDLF